MGLIKKMDGWWWLKLGMKKLKEEFDSDSSVDSVSSVKKQVVFFFFLTLNSFTQVWGHGACSTSKKSVFIKTFFLVLWQRITLYIEILSSHSDTVMSPPKPLCAKPHREINSETLARLQITHAFIPSKLNFHYIMKEERKNEMSFFIKYSLFSKWSKATNPRPRA